MSSPLSSACTVLWGRHRPDRSFKGGWGAGILGALSLLFGILILGNVWASTWVIGIRGIVGGIIAIIVAFKTRTIYTGEFGAILRVRP